MLYFGTKTAGTIEIRTIRISEYDGFLHFGEVKTADKLHEVVTKSYGGYDYVKRPNGKTEKGLNYTMKKATNDFKKYSV